LDDNVVHVAVGLRLGANICKPHQCSCGAEIDARGVHALSCKGGSGRSTEHHSLNDLVWRDQWRTFSQPRSRRVFSGPMESNPTGLHWFLGRKADA